MKLNLYLVEILVSNFEEIASFLYEVEEWTKKYMQYLDYLILKLIY